MTTYGSCHIKLNKQGQRGKQLQPIQFLGFDEWTKFVCAMVCVCFCHVFMSLSISVKTNVLFI